MNHFDPKHLMQRFAAFVKRYKRLLLLISGVVLLCVTGGALIRYAARGIHEYQLQKELQAMIAAQPSAEPTIAPTPVPQPAATPEITQAVITEAPTATSQPTATPQPTVQPKVQSLIERNPDSVGWLKAGCIAEIDLPVVQRDNSYYMNHSFDGSYNEYGTTFLDQLCDLNAPGGNLIIYGHNMRTGQMFGKLNRLRDLSLLLYDPIFVLDTPYAQTRYVPIAVFICSVKQSDDNYFPIIVPFFGGEEHFNGYIARAKELSVHKNLPDAVYGDRMLSLVTCYSDNEAARFVVVLRALREGETTQSIIEQMRR